MRAGGGMKWVQSGFCGYPGMMLALVTSKLLWKATTGGLVASVGMTKERATFP
jgi:hypothetical protein